eukprot:CAMPEP_0203985114 /NCGR_PEP_ID=MMETSP0360-20130528/5112_1 /ASSEMBLY_ACC=CAM_ASM_000342 /TAXON_ID=268821 /ORGANISM="Scrippsiella Hangoei, Strain SHTV-5" /LENGTH=57 /DNA_ID=CAMNT_0050924357 /DNA_START=62 /DNA_END=232 /DNA_ORIENTATION=-
MHRFVIGRTTEGVALFDERAAVDAALHIARTGEGKHQRFLVAGRHHGRRDRNHASKE